MERGIKVEIINTGAELLLGDVLNTHQQWLCKRLAQIGLPVSRQTLISDDADEIVNAIKEACQRSDLIILTGGLGPTSDDRTRDTVAKLFNRKLIIDDKVLKHISDYFSSRKREQPESTKIQACVPEGATVLMNKYGTAPGIVIEEDIDCGSGLKRKVLIALLPGPTRELKPMFDEQLIPIIKEKFIQNIPYICSVLKTAGIGESKVEETLGDSLKKLQEQGLTIGYCARVGEVDIRVEARGEKAQELITQAEQIIRHRIGDYIYGSGDESLEEVVVKLLTKNKLVLATAESCTGGLLSHRITNIPGASLVFWGGLVTYANEAKHKILGVSLKSLSEHGAVSEQVAKEMAEGLLKLSNADYAISITGIAGPSGGTPQKPLGTVFIGLATKDFTDVKKMFNPYDRETFKRVTTQQALELLRRSILNRKV